jgi:hypothetical protein
MNRAKRDDDPEYKLLKTVFPKVEALLKEKTGNFLTPPCDDCKDDYFSREWKVETYEIEEH